jgi:hypothetical protein
VANLQVTNTYEGTPSLPICMLGSTQYIIFLIGTNVRPIFLSADLEEGLNTDNNIQDIHALILGKAITGIPAFAS